MTFLTEFFTNRIVLICFLTWFLSQSIKFFIYYVKQRKIKYSQFLASGGMPSSHAAVTMTFTTLLYMGQGMSTVFLLSVLVLVLTVHDVLFLRKHTGEHARTLNHLQRNKKLEEVIGHEPLEVAAGLVLGLIIALVLG